MPYAWAEQFLLELPGVTDNWQTDWGWHRFYVGDKFFCALCFSEQRELIFITLKLPPEESELLRGQYPDVIPGYYMNKVHWSSVKATGEVPEDVVRTMLEHSWRTGFQALTKKKQQAILPAADK